MQLPHETFEVEGYTRSEKGMLSVQFFISPIRPAASDASNNFPLNIKSPDIDVCLIYDQAGRLGFRIREEVKYTRDTALFLYPVRM